MRSVGNSILPILLFGIITLCGSEDGTAQTNTNETRKSIKAIKANPHAPKVDGKLDDPIWQSAEFHSDFLQRLPNEGAEPLEKTEVAVVYDENALYVGARLYCNSPEKLRMHLERRDNQGPAEQFIVSIDSYFDRRTGFGFGVNTSGVRFDRYYPEDSEGSADYSFNPVWHAHTSVDDKGWIAEIEIPFSQLRFTAKPEQTWGINFNRWIPERNEDTYWVYTPREETGFISRFGDLIGIAGIKPSRRIEILPYFASDASFVDGDFTGNPFDDGKDVAPRVGGDLKMGLGPNLTLDATFNPDFGQVEADPATINLSAFEIIYSEKRPFFTEGGLLLEGNGPGYFYSRRVGGPPHDNGVGEIVHQPSNSTILGASKVTGKLKSGTSIGLLTALTQREYARNYDRDTDSTYKTQIEPMTFYSVARIEQQFGKERSTVGISLTGVGRDLNGVTRLEERLRKSAVAGGADWRLKFDKGIYELYGHSGFSHVEGSPSAIARTQRSSARYFQRPDADYLEYDSTRTSLTGYTARLGLRKSGGRHWLWNMSFNAESPNFELNDAGRLGQADDLDAEGYIAYRENKPGKLFRNYYLEASGYANWNYGGIRQFSEAGLYSEFTLPNYINFYYGLRRQFPGQDDTRTRGGPTMKNEAGYSTEVGFSSNHTGTTRMSASFNYGVDELSGWLWTLGSSLSSRIGNRMELAINPRYTREDQPRQYVTSVADHGGGEGTYGVRYVFSRIARTTISATLRVNYYFTSNFSLEVYAEPYAANGKYHQHGELIRSRGHDLRFYGLTEGTAIEQVQDEATGELYYSVSDGSESFTLPFLDFGVRSFRSNIVLRWEFRPGSTVYLVWQRSLGEDKEIGRTVGPGALFDSFGAQGEDFVAFKIAHWIPIS